MNTEFAGLRRLNEKQVVAAVRSWVDDMVVDLNLCPFARPELAKDRVRFVATTAATETDLLSALQTELAFLQAHSDIETTLLIHPQALPDFSDYNQFLDLVDGLIQQLKLDGVFQVASFHPHYQFAGTTSDAAENYTNRAPHPVLHILREESLARAIDAFPDVAQIPVRNVALMNQMGGEKLQAILKACLRDSEAGV